MTETQEQQPEDEIDEAMRKLASADPLVQQVVLAATQQGLDREDCLVEIVWQMHSRQLRMMELAKQAAGIGPPRALLVGADGSTIAVEEDPARDVLVAQRQALELIGNLLDAPRRSEAGDELSAIEYANAVAVAMADLIQSSLEESDIQ